MIEHVKAQKCEKHENAKTLKEENAWKCEDARIEDVKAQQREKNENAEKAFLVFLFSRFGGCIFLARSLF